MKASSRRQNEKSEKRRFALQMLTANVSDYLNYDKTSRGLNAGISRLSGNAWGKANDIHFNTTTDMLMKHNHWQEVKD